MLRKYKICSILRQNIHFTFSYFITLCNALMSTALCIVLPPYTTLSYTLNTKLS
jgi:hypothetical protein